MSSDTELSTYIDLLLSHEEYLRDELLRVKRLRQEMERLIPDSYNHLFNQINDIIEAYDNDNGNGAATDQG